MKPLIPGVIRSFDDVSSNTHALPILASDRDFQTYCLDCNRPAGPRRTTMQAALADRMSHQRSTHP